MTPTAFDPIAFATKFDLLIFTKLTSLDVLNFESKLKYNAPSLKLCFRGQIHNTSFTLKLINVPNKLKCWPWHAFPSLRNKTL